MRELVALYDHAPRQENVGDVSALVVTHTVYVKLALDEEWRSYYGANAFTVANNALEAADDEMYSQFGINMYWNSSYNWDTSPDTARNQCDIFAEMGPGHDDIPLGAGNDVVVGYSKNAGGSGGCADTPGNHALIKWESTALGRWEVSQHEFSHMFGAPDRYGPCCDYPNHPTDVMENQYEEPNFWCTAIGYADWLIMSNGAGRFD
jgi:hypothetical protein